MKIKVSDKAVVSRRATDEIIRAFSEISGDYNQVLLDSEFAEKSIFGKRIAPGLFCQGMISNVIGNILPGEGSIFINETINYRSPVYINDLITCEVTVAKIVHKSKVELIFCCMRENQEVVADGSALVKVL